MTEHMTEPGRARPGQIRLRTTSLRRRVTLSVLIVLAAVLFGVVLTVNGLFPVYARRDINDLLTTRIAQAQVLAREDLAPMELVRRMDAQGVRARVVLPNGQRFGVLAPTDIGPSMTRTATLNGTGSLAGAQLTLAADTSAVTSAQQRLRKILLLTALVAVAITAIVLVATVRFALAPLEAMARLARSIAGGDRGRGLHQAVGVDRIGVGGDRIAGHGARIGLARRADRVAIRLTPQLRIDHDLFLQRAGELRIAEVVRLKVSLGERQFATGGLGPRVRVNRIGGYKRGGDIAVSIEVQVMDAKISANRLLNCQKSIPVFLTVCL